MCVDERTVARSGTRAASHAADRPWSPLMCTCDAACSGRALDVVKSVEAELRAIAARSQYATTDVDRVVLLGRRLMALEDGPCPCAHVHHRDTSETLDDAAWAGLALAVERIDWLRPVLAFAISDEQCDGDEERVLDVLHRVHGRGR